MNRQVKYIIGSAALLIVAVSAISLYNVRVRQNALVLMSGQTPSVIGTATGTNPIIATTTSNPMEPNTKEPNKDITVNNSPKPYAAAPARSSPTPPVSKTGCGLHLSVVPRSKTVTPQGTIIYDLTLTNAGTIVCKNTSISVYYNENESFVSATPPPTANNYYFYVGDLAPGAVFKTTIITRHISNNSPQISNEVCATADNVNDACVDNLILIDDNAPQNQTAAAAVEKPRTSDTVSVSINADIGLLVENPENKEVGIWEWNSPLQMTSAYQNQVLSLLKKYGFNTIYITIDDYLKIAALTDPAKKVAEKDAYFTHLAAFVGIAKAKGFSVDVEGGWKDWSFPENRYKGYALIDFVEEYNRLYPNLKVRGLQYDVEPYLLPGYDENRGPILTEYLEFLDESVKRMQKVDAEFSVVVPHFYHSVKQWTPAVTYGGKTAYPYTHILNILSRKSGSKILVMAYRNFFEGEDGIQEIATPNLTEASRGNYPVKVIVAQETGNVDPDYVTFHRKTKKDLSRTLSAITNTYKGETSFGGVAVNYVDPFFQLK